MAQTPDRLEADALRAEITADEDAELDRIKAAVAKLQADRAVKLQMAEEVRAKHLEAAEAARRDLKAIPPMPDLPDVQPENDGLTSLMWAKSELGVRRVQALAAAVPLVESSWEDARPSLDGRAREIADPVEALALEYAAWWSLQHDARHAAEHADPNVTNHNGPSERMRPKPTAADVLIAATGVDLCGVRSVHSSRSPVTGDRS